MVHLYRKEYLISFFNLVLVKELIKTKKYVKETNCDYWMNPKNKIQHGHCLKWRIPSFQKAAEIFSVTKDDLHITVNI